MKKIVVIIGILLILGGIVSLINPKFSYEKNEKLAEVGNVQLHANEEKPLNIPPAASIVAIIAGLALVYASRK